MKKTNKDPIEYIVTVNGTAEEFKATARSPEEAIKIVRSNNAAVSLRDVRNFTARQVDETQSPPAAPPMPVQNAVS